MISCGYLEILQSDDCNYSDKIGGIEKATPIMPSSHLSGAHAAKDVILRFAPAIRQHILFTF